MGYDVHVITHESRELDATGRPTLRCRSPATVHRCAERVRSYRSRAAGCLRTLANSLLRRLLAPVGWEYPLGPGRHAQGARSRAQHCRAAVGHRHLAGARGGDRRRAHRAPARLAADPRLSRSVERARLAALAPRRGSRNGSRGASSGGCVRRSAARVLNTPAMRASFEEFFPALPTARNFVIPNGFEARRARSRRRRPTVRSRSCTPARSSRRPLAAAGAARRRATAHASSAAPDPRHHLRRPAGGGTGSASATSGSSLRRSAAAHSVRRRCSPSCSARTCCSRWSAITCCIRRLTRCTTTWRPAGPSSGSRRAARRCSNCSTESGAGDCVESGDVDRHRAGARANFCSRRAAGARACRPLSLVEPGAAVSAGRSRPSRTTHQ